MLLRNQKCLIWTYSFLCTFKDFSTEFLAPNKASSSTAPALQIPQSKNACVVACTESKKRGGGAYAVALLQHKKGPFPQACNACTVTCAGHEGDGTFLSVEGGRGGVMGSLYHGRGCYKTEGGRGGLQVNLLNCDRLSLSHTLQPYHIYMYVNSSLFFILKRSLLKRDGKIRTVSFQKKQRPLSYLDDPPDFPKKW